MELPQIASFFRKHQPLEGNSDKDVVYRTMNIYSQNIDKRFAGVPHLIKTSRDCLANSGSGRCTRFMWNSGMFKLWSHISQFYYRDMECGLKMLTKLTNDHMNLTPYSVMRGRLGVQVLIQTVCTCLNNFGPPEAAGAAKFCIMVDKFFDCLNVTF